MTPGATYFVGRFVDRSVILPLLVTLLVLAFGIAPLVSLMSAALSDGRAQLWTELTRDGTLRAWSNTIFLAAGVTVIAVPVGALWAWLIERTDLFRRATARRMAVALMTLPVAVPPYLLAMAWALLGNGRNGLINRWLGVPVIDLYGLDGAILVLATSAYPFTFLAVRATLIRADPSLEQAARVSGAGPFRVLIDVTLPLVRPALGASAGLTFVFASAAFGVPYLLGSVADTPMLVLTTLIFRYTTLGGETMLAKATALAIALLATSLLVQGLAIRWAQRRSTVQVQGKATRQVSVRLGRWRSGLHLVWAAFLTIFIATPILTIAATSLRSTFAPDAEWTISHWQNVWAREETIRAFGHSFALALVTGAVVAVVGLIIARAQGPAGPHRTSWVGNFTAAAASLPHAVPGTVLAIGLLLAFTAEYRLVLLDSITFALYLPGTLAFLAVAYAVKYLAFGVRGARSALDQIHPSLEEAARLSGADPVRAGRDILWPLASPAAAAAFVIVALPCLSELTMSVLLFDAQTETAGTLLFELQSYADPPAASVVAIVIVAIALATHAIIHRWAGQHAQSISEEP